MADSEFFKFPRTSHLFTPPKVELRGDHVFSEAERKEFLSGEIVVEEKVDGANVGFSVANDGLVRVQNRGAYIEQPAPLQFQPLWHWLAERKPELAAQLEPGLIVFGEWCFAVHSVRYCRLTDWFIGFDVYDSRQKKFWASERRNMLLKSLRIQTISEIARDRFDVDGLRRLLASKTSAYGNEAVEGLYLRRESHGLVDGRAKIVRPAFVQSIEGHWTSRPLEKNSVLR
jgi:ATP-dependent RNA circularization protein (DNA/RNA ligase family)